MSSAPQAEQQHAPRRRGLAVTLGCAAVVVAGIAGFALRPATGVPALQAASIAEETALAVTLPPASAGQMLDDAKACRLRLAHVEIWHGDGAPDAVVQIKSGNYLSPPFTLTTTPERIAVPFPAAYEAGSGIIAVVGTAHSVAVSLSPVARFADVAGAAPINVVWDTSKPCG